MKHLRACRAVGAALVCVVLLMGCKASEQKAPHGGVASPDAGSSAPDSATAAVDTRGDIAAVVRADSPKPAAFVEFEAMLEELEKQPPSPARSKATCALSGMDKRVVVFAPARVPRPAHVGEAEWEQATHELWDTDIDIGEMCEDMDGKPEGGEDEKILQLLRQRYERLVQLTRTP